jgi:hypothetical protein
MAGIGMPVPPPPVVLLLVLPVVELHEPVAPPEPVPLPEVVDEPLPVDVAPAEPVGLLPPFVLALEHAAVIKRNENKPRFAAIEPIFSLLPFESFGQLLSAKPRVRVRRTARYRRANSR